MVNTKKLVQMVRKWRKMTGAGRKRITIGGSVKDQMSCSAVKGHFVVYTMDEKRFMIPMKYIVSDVFKELLRMSEEEFGLPCNGPITIPCEAVFLDYIVSLIGIGGCLSQDLEKALCMCVEKSCGASSSVPLVEQHRHTSSLLIQSY